MEHVVLFVDDEPNIIRGILRAFLSGHSHWKVLSAQSGQEALKILAETEVDIIVTDMRMPHMNGKELLEIVMRLYPAVSRIILSGLADRQELMGSINVAHQFLVKPINFETLQHTLDGIGNLRNLIKDRQVLEQVSALEMLQAAPTQYLNLLDLLEQEDVSTSRVAESIAGDPAMTARTLQLVNSAFFGLPLKISDLCQAVALLGFDIIRSLVYYTNLIACWDKSKRNRGFGSPEEFWRHSVSVSALAKRIAILEQADTFLVNDALVSGLLHDLGKLVVSDIQQYRQVFQASTSVNSCFSYKEEYALANTSHAEAGGYLLGLWALPQRVIDAVAFHHQPTGINETSFSALAATHLANSIVNHQNLLAQGEDIDIYEIVDQEYLSSIEWKHDLSYYLALAGTKQEMW